jgi:arabinose-5-phosphate isomerase
MTFLMDRALARDTKSTVAERDPAGVTGSAERTMRAGINALTELHESLGGSLGDAFLQAVRMISETRGRVIVTGIGKSGHIASKIAATLASTGTTAFFVHPSEASHGDLGMLLSEDTVIALSWSGETPELAAIVGYTRRFKVNLIAITSRVTSALGRAADIVLELPQVQEACPHGLAATSSALVQLALGDALAIALLELSGFTAEDFRTRHPGGLLGARLRTVREMMHSGSELPLVPEGTLMKDGILEMSTKGFGCLGVTAADGRLAGIITDGDLRRHMATDVLNRPVQTLMTRSPKAIEQGAFAGAALQVLNENKISALFVVEDERPVGLVHLHDLLRVGVA